MSDHHHDHGGEDSSFGDLLDLDGDVLHEYWADALSFVRRAAGGDRRRRIVDLGAGTGTGTLRLAHRFAGAEIIAVDADAALLHRVRTKALDQGLADRITTVHADLDETWPVPGPVDLTWASLSLHHLADPDRVLRDVHAATRDGGLIAVAEFPVQIRFLPDEAGSGLETRLLEGLEQHQAERLPELGTDWPARLAAAGFTLVDERTFDIDLSPAPPATAAYAAIWFGRMARHVDDLDPADASALEELLDGDGPGSLHRRDDLRVRGTRTVMLARR
ncbi:class I SAM-dependent methyltransferase [Jiangella alkaliphila]|uniref:Methyltransferase domain-containing protein n=1 Tax=Jiangella alkaliphila TaxID=419479 RepID=A0A1H2IYP8_9ACTN|nr:class I SAM-dependent methyltransferase [Jiangella alkaliphila]SDU49101.1 Methyltransferase domain-containing protein [Jiangella alkaliphila]